MSQEMRYSIGLEDGMTPVLDQIAETLSALNDTVAELASSMTDAFSVADDAIAQDQDLLASLADTMADLSAAADALVGAVGDKTSALYEDIAAADEDSASLDSLSESLATASDESDGLAAASGGLAISFGQILQFGLLAVGGLTLLAKNALSSADSYEVAMAKVKGLTGQTSETMAALNTAIMNMSAQFGVAPTELANGFYYLLSANLKLNDAMQVMPIVIEGAKGAMTDTATYANLLTSMMQVFGDKTKTASQNAQQMSDILIAMVVHGKVSFDQLVASFGRMLVGTSLAGTSVYEMAGAFDVLTLNASTAKQAETSFGSAVKDVMDLPDRFAKNATKLGLAFDAAKFASMDFYNRVKYLYDLVQGNKEDFFKLFTNKTSATLAFALIQDGGAQWQAMMKQIEASTGATQYAFDAFKQTTQQAFNNASASAQRFFDGVHDAVKGPLDAAINAVGGTFDAILPFIESHSAQIREALLTIGSVLLGLLIPAIGGMLAALGGALVAAAPFIGIGLLIAALVPLIRDAWEHSQSFRSAILGLADSVGRFVGTVGPPFLALLSQVRSLLASAIVAILPVVAGITSALLNALGPIIAIVLRLASILIVELGGAFRAIATNVGNFLSPLIGLWKNLSVGMGGLSSAVHSMATALGVVGNPLGSFRDILRQIDPILKVWYADLAIAAGIVGHVFAFVLIGVMPILMALKNAIGVIFPAAFNIIKGSLTAILGVFQFVFGFISGLLNIFHDIFTGNWKKIGSDALAAVQEMGTGLENIFKGLFSAIINAVMGLVGAVIAFFASLVINVIHAIQGLFDKLVGHSIIPDLVNAIISWIAQLPGKVIGFIVNMVTGFISQVISLDTRVTAAFISLVGNIASTISGAVGRFVSGALSWVTGIINALKGLITQGPSIMASFGQGMLNALGQIGPNLVNGVKNLAGNLLSSMKNALGIHSPSTLTHDMGLMLSQGLINGVRALDIASPIAKHFQNGLTTGAAKLSVSGGVAIAGGGSGTGTTNVTITMNGGLGAGLQLLNPTDRRRFAQQIADVLGQQTNRQGINNASYTGAN